LFSEEKEDGLKIFYFESTPTLQKIGAVAKAV